MVVAPDAAGVVGSVVAPGGGVSSPESEPRPERPTTTSTVMATMAASATTTRFDSIRRRWRRRGWVDVDWAKGISSEAAKRELYSSR